MDSILTFLSIAQSGVTLALAIMILILLYKDRLKRHIIFMVASYLGLTISTVMVTTTIDWKDVALMIAAVSWVLGDIGLISLLYITANKKI